MPKHLTSLTMQAGVGNVRVSACMRRVHAYACVCMFVRFDIQITESTFHDPKFFYSSNRQKNNLRLPYHILYFYAFYHVSFAGGTQLRSF